MAATVTWADGILNTTFNQRQRDKPFNTNQGVSPRAKLNPEITVNNN